MTQFNINDRVLVCITDKGWDYLGRTVGYSYIKHCVEPYQQVVEGKEYHSLQPHEVMMLFGQSMPANPSTIESIILIP